jgi:hypothetical protein
MNSAIDIQKWIDNRAVLFLYDAASTDVTTRAAKRNSVNRRISFFLRVVAKNAANTLRNTTGQYDLSLMRGQGFAFPISPR